MPVYLIQTPEEHELDVAAQFPDSHPLWPGVTLVDSEQSQSQVYHTFKRAIPNDSPLFIATLDQQPKYKGGSKGLLKWLRERYDSMPG